MEFLCHYDNFSNEFFPPSQNDCLVYLLGQKCEAQSKIFSRQTFIIKKSFNTVTAGGVLEQLLFFYFKSHTYNYSVNGQRALILPKLGTWTIILRRREQFTNIIIPNYFQFIHFQNFAYSTGLLMCGCVHVLICQLLWVYYASLYFCNEILSWIFEILLANHLVSDNICKIEDL